MRWHFLRSSTTANRFNSVGAFLPKVVHLLRKMPNAFQDKSDLCEDTQRDTEADNSKDFASAEKASIT